MPSPLTALVGAIQAALSDDLLSPYYRNLPRAHPTEGHCYVAAEAAWHLYGKARGYRAMTVPRGYADPDDPNATHWFLEHPVTGDRIDPTAEQYPEGPPYQWARPCGFLTRSPSARARTVIERVLARQPMEVAA